MQVPQIETAPDGRSDDIDACRAALEPGFEAVTSGGPISMGSAAGAEIPEELEALIDSAESAGWSRDTAEAAIRDLAREELGAMGASFD